MTLIEQLFDQRTGNVCRGELAEVRQRRADLADVVRGSASEHSDVRVLVHVTYSGGSQVRRERSPQRVRVIVADHLDSHDLSTVDRDEPAPPNSARDDLPKATTLSVDQVYRLIDQHWVEVDREVRRVTNDDHIVSVEAEDRPARLRHRQSACPIPTPDHGPECARLSPHTSPPRHPNGSTQTCHYRFGDIGEPRRLRIGTLATARGRSADRTTAVGLGSSASR